MDDSSTQAVRVQYVVDLPNDTRPTNLPGSTRAVLTAGYAQLDLDPGGVTAEELHAEDVQALAVFPVGTDVLVESGDPADCLDDSTEKSEQATHIWWRASLVAG